MEQVAMPRELVAAARREGRQAWLATLPSTIATLARRWSIVVEAPFQPGGQAAWVAPARTADGRSVVLKVAWPHPEAAHEADGLRAWRGDGAVRLHGTCALDDAIALLIERCVPGTALAARPEPEQDVVIADRLNRLWREPAPGHPFRSLQTMCDQWADEFDVKVSTGGPLQDPGLARDGIALFRALPASADRNVTLCTDLHAGNVLAAGREPWLVIDPKPYVGDPHYDVVQHVINCEERLSGDPRGLARRMADLAGLDPDRVLLWVFARCIQESPDRPALAAVARRIAPS